MDINQTFVLCNQNYFIKTSNQFPNINEPIISTTNNTFNTTNNINNYFYANYKATNKKSIPFPNQKFVQSTSPNPSSIARNSERKVYSKGYIKKNVKNNNLEYNRAMSQINMDLIKNQIAKNTLNVNKSQLFSPHELMTDSLNKRLKPQISNKKKPGLSNSNANKNLMELNSGEEDMDNIDNIINTESINDNCDSDGNVINGSYNIRNNDIKANITNITSDGETNCNTLSNEQKYRKKYNNQLFKGYYTEACEQKQEKSPVLNVEELLMIEEKLAAIISCVVTNNPCAEECFEWFNFYYNTSLSINLHKYFIKDDYIKIIKRAINLKIFSLMLCYDISLNEVQFMQNQNYLNSILGYDNCILILVSKYFCNKIADCQNPWVDKLNQLVSKYIPNNKKDSEIFNEINIYCNKLIQDISNTLNNYPNRNLINIYNQIDSLTSNDLKKIYREKIHQNLNQNGSILASSSYFKENKISNHVPVPYLKNQSNKQYTLVLDLDETLIHFKINPNNEASGTLQFRPFLSEFISQIKKLFELVVFTAATQDYADPIIDAIEQKSTTFDHRLYRYHTVVIDNDFVKDLSKLGRDLSRVIIVDNMKQNYKLQPNNGITIRPFWGKDSNDMVLFDLYYILKNIVMKDMDVRTGLEYYKEEIMSRVTSNIYRRSKNKF